MRMEGGVLEEWDASAEVLQSDTMDQFRTFQMCERLLHNPSKLANQLLFQIPPHRQAMLIERYVFRPPAVCASNWHNVWPLVRLALLRAHDCPASVALHLALHEIIISICDSLSS